MGRKAQEPKITFVNKPDPAYIWEVLCDLLNRQDPEYEYRLVPRDRKKQEAQDR